MHAGSFREIVGSSKAALVVQGGGMRGTYSIAALAAMQSAGLTEYFTDIYGTSAGALNGAYFIAGQAEEGVGIYVDHLSNKRFINKLRLRRIIDIDYLVDDVLTHRVPLDIAAVCQSSTRLHVGLTSASTGQLVWESNDGRWPLLETLRATAALPIVFGREVEIGQDRYVDGGVSVKLPLLAAVEAGHENVVVVLTRALGYKVSEVNPLITRLTRLAAGFKGHSPAIVNALGVTDPTFPRALQLLRHGDPEEAGPTIWTVAPSAAIAGRLTANRAILERTAALGRADVREALGL